MIHIPGGTFMIPEGPYTGTSKSMKQIFLDGFHLCRFLVNQKLWEDVMGEKPSYFQNPNRPVEGISWNEITKKFLPALNDKPGYENYCLPTCAQWEYAATGGRKESLLSLRERRHDFHNGGVPKELGWYGENRFGETQVIAHKRPNTLGLYDMIGGVREWCQDKYGMNFYEALKDQKGEEFALDPKRVNEKKSRAAPSNRLQFIRQIYVAAAPQYLPPDFERNDLGFRLSKYSPT
ncbi:MAG: formylglycine-generating enzyme family protein [Bacteroidota bacterium]